MLDNRGQIRLYIGISFHTLTIKSISSIIVISYIFISFLLLYFLKHFIHYSFFLKYKGLLYISFIQFLDMKRQHVIAVIFKQNTFFLILYLNKNNKVHFKVNI